MAKKERARAKVGRKVSTSRQWDTLAGSVAGLARTYEAQVTVCINTRGEVSIVIGGDGTRLSPVAGVAGAEARSRIEDTWRLRRDGFALYRQQVPAQVGRPSDKVGSRTAPVFRAPQPESAPVGLEDGPAYTEEQKAALRAFLEGED